MNPLHEAVPGALADLLRRVPLSDGKVAFAWRAAVGHALARASTVQLTRARVLNVEVADDHWRREIERSTSVILARLTSLLGPDAATAVSVRVRPATSAIRSDS